MEFLNEKVETTRGPFFIAQLSLFFWVEEAAGLMRNGSRKAKSIESAVIPILMQTIETVGLPT